MKNTALTLSKNESDAIQALRFVAALLVYFQHVVVYALYIKDDAVPWFWPLHAGGTGVCIFFVISGFIMSMKLNDDPKEFLLKRILRIYPSFWLFAVISLGLQYILIGRHAIPHATSLALLPSAIDDNSLQIPSWTLVYEVIFYFVCTIICAAKPIRPALPYFLLLWFSAIEFTQVFVGEVSHASPTLGQIMFSEMNLYFIAGMFFGLYRKKINLTLWGCVALIIITHANVVHKVSGLQSTVLLSATCGFTILAMMKFSYNTRICQVVAKCGNYSYGLYLAHLPLVFIASTIMKPHARSFMSALAVIVATTFPVAMILAALEHRFHKRISTSAWRMMGSAKTPTRA